MTIDQAIKTPVCFLALYSFSFFFASPLCTEDGLYILLPPDRSKKRKHSSTTGTKISKAPPHLQHLVLDPIPFRDDCPWSPGAPQFLSPTSTRQRYCYPEGRPSHSSVKGGTLWTEYDNTEGRENLEYRLLHVYSLKYRKGYIGSKDHLDHMLSAGADRGFVDEVKQLLEAGADPASEENLPIRKAAENGHTEIVRLLLRDKRVDPGVSGGYVCGEYRFALKKASENGHREIVRLLLQDKRVYNYVTVTKELFSDLMQMIEKDTLSPTVDVATVMDNYYWSKHSEDLRRALKIRHKTVVRKVATLARSNTFQCIFFEGQCSIVVDHFAYALFPFQNEEEKQAKIRAMMKCFIGRLDRNK